MRILLLFLLVQFVLLSCDDKKSDAQEKPVSSTSKPAHTQETSEDVNIKSFAIQYTGDLNFDFCKRDVVFIDMYDYSKEDVFKCKKMGAVVYGYFSSQFEDWRPDSSKFPTVHLGEDLDKWPSEKWVNTKSNKIRALMVDRIVYAKNKGFDGIDVDNVDGYGFNTGFPYSKKDSADYVNFFIETAHKFDMKFSLKNAMELIPIIKKSDFYQNESCYRYKKDGKVECHMYDSVSGPIGIIRYKRRCPKNIYKRAFTILKKRLNKKDKLCD